MDVERIRPGIVRVRKGSATASFYESSRRVVLVADDGAFDEAIAALAVLRDEVG